MTRDMTWSQFAAALKREGFSLQLLWLHDSQTGVGWPLLIQAGTGRIFRRASLAYALRRRKERLAADATKAALAAEREARAAGEASE